jgi:DeoR/GlpR family transcriptional regulator of sugar metabolism
LSIDGCTAPVGAFAATLVDNSSSLLINAGTTTLAVVRHLRDRRDLTVATNNLLLPADITPKVFRDLYVFGGAVRLSAMATVGPVAFPSRLNGAHVNVRSDLAFIAVGAVSTDTGYSTSNVGEAAMMSEMMDRAARVAILADSSKFRRRLFAQVAGLARADYLVTDAAPPPELAEALRRHHVEVLTPVQAPAAGAYRYRTACPAGSVYKIVTARRQLEVEGFVVRRCTPASNSAGPTRSSCWTALRRRVRAGPAGLVGLGECCGRHDYPLCRRFGSLGAQAASRRQARLDQLGSDEVGLGHSDGLEMC